MVILYEIALVLSIFYRKSGYMEHTSTIHNMPGCPGIQLKSREKNKLTQTRDRHPNTLPEPPTTQSHIAQP